MKSKACKEAGIYSIAHEMPESISQDNILEIITMMNKNPNIDGILVQLPLPKHVDTTAILEAIDPRKDVDGFHPYNVGRVVRVASGCGPAGMRLLCARLQPHTLAAVHALRQSCCARHHVFTGCDGWN